MIDWIRVKDRLPEKSGEYLICANRYVCAVEFSTRHKKFNAFDILDDANKVFSGVTHWAYINLPKEEEDE